MHIPFRYLALLSLLQGCGDSTGLPQIDSGADVATSDATADTSQPDAGLDMPSSDALPAPTWTNFTEAFIGTYCLGCHGASAPTNLSTYADVVTNSGTARCGVAVTPQPGCGSFPPPKQFPVGNGPTPTDAERIRFVAWVDDGTPL